MNKKTALYLMLGCAAVSLYDLMGEGNPVYGEGKPLKDLRWKVYTTATGTNWYVSITDIGAAAGAFFYFK